MYAQMKMFFFPWGDHRIWPS